MKTISNDDIAIIGYAFDLPNGVDTKDKYWDVLYNGKDMIEEIPKERWDWKKIYDADYEKQGKAYAYQGGFLKNIDQFDPQAFRLNPRESSFIDPQQRLVLKIAWHAMENSNLPIESLNKSKTGVFIGATMDEYLQLQTRVNEGKNINIYTHTGSVLNNVAGRVSFVYGFRGPSVTLDTACSSSLVAIDQAVKSLKDGDCNLALAGGVNMMLNEEMYIKLCKARMLSPDGRCKTFDDSANGYVRGEGCGIFVLEKLSKAKENGHHILAVIRGITTNHNGNSSGLTVPSGAAQQALIKQCMEKANVEPSELSYVEAHGTGTQLGDKIEIQALQQVFDGERKTPLKIGSVKTNIGHLESASGVASMLKVMLSFEKGIIPPSIHLKKRNQKIKWRDDLVQVVTENQKWDESDKLAGVSSFGASGTNAFVILQSYQSEETDQIEEQENFCLALSAKSYPSLYKLLLSYKQFLKGKTKKEISNICRINNLVRSQYSCRIAVFGETIDEFMLDFERKIIELQDLQGGTNKKGTDSKDEINIEIKDLRTAAEAFEKKVKVDFSQWYTNQKNLNEQLPTYEFNESSYWLPESRHLCEEISDYPEVDEALYENISFSVSDKAEWVIAVNPEKQVISGHKLNRNIVVAGTLQLVLAQRLLKKVFGHACIVKNWVFMDKVSVSGITKMKIILNSITSEVQTGEIFYLDAKSRKWKLCSKFEGTGVNHEELMEPSWEEEWEKIDAETFYKKQKESGLNLSECYHVLDNICIGERQSQATLVNSSNIPAKLDAGSQLLTYVSQMGQTNDKLELFIPQYFKEFVLYNTYEKADRVACELKSRTSSSIKGNLYYYAGKNLVATYEEYTLVKYRGRTMDDVDFIQGRRLELSDNSTIYLHDLNIVGTSLEDHRVYNKLTVPGAFYISQIMHLAKGKFQSQRYEIHTIDFYNAVVVEDEAFVTESIHVKEETGTYLIETKTCVNDKKEFMLNAKMQLTLEVDEEDTHWDVEAHQVDGDVLKKEEILALQEKTGLNVGSSFNWMEEGVFGKDLGLFTLQNSSFDDLTESYGVAPGLVDTAAQSLGLIKNYENKESGVYIPINASALKVYQELENDMYCYCEILREGSNNILIGNVTYVSKATGCKILEFQELNLIKADEKKLGKTVKSEGYVFEERFSPVSTGADGEVEKETVYQLTCFMETSIVDIKTYEVENKQYSLQKETQISSETKEEFMRSLSDAITLTGNETWVIKCEQSKNARNYVKDTKMLLQVFEYFENAGMSDSSVVVLTNSLQKITADDVMGNEFEALVWGLTASIQLEIKGFKVFLADLDCAWSDCWSLIKQAMLEDIKKFAVRRNELYSFTIRKHISGESKKSSMKVTDQGTYVVFGGCGGLGSKICDMLANQGAGKVIAVGKSEYGQRQKVVLESLEKQNVITEYVQADISDENSYDKLDDVFANNKVNGVFHVSGVVRDMYYSKVSLEDIKNVYDAKVYGSLLIEKLLLKYRSSYYVCFSSIVSIIGSVGQTIYGAANRFEDMICQRLRSQEITATCIQWGPWNEVGMFTKVSAQGVKRLEERGIFTMEPDIAVSCLHSLLGENENVIVANMKLTPEKKADKTHKIKKTVEKTVKKEEAQSEQEENTEDKLLNIIRELLEMPKDERIDLDSSFLDLGIDSLLAIEIRADVNKQFSVNIPLDAFFDELTIDELIQKVEDEIDGVVMGEI